MISTPDGKPARAPWHMSFGGQAFCVSTEVLELLAMGVALKHKEIYLQPNNLRCQKCREIIEKFPSR